MEALTHYGVDVRSGRHSGERFITLNPCCEGQAEAIARRGYALAYRRELVEVIEEIIPHEVLEIIHGGDGTVVCRLSIANPTQVGGSADSQGTLKASSPRGWQSSLFALVDEHHRHHPAPQGWKFGIRVSNGDVPVGIATVGRPVSRHLQDQNPRMLEVTRVCTWGHDALRANAVTMLYAEAARQSRALGYDRLVTYTLHGVESGHSLLSSGWTPTGLTDGESWVRPSRPDASTTAPTGPKVRWERGLSRAARRVVSRRRISIPPAMVPPTQPALHLTIGETP